MKEVIGMTTQDATLLAATIAATVAVLNTLITIFKDHSIADKNAFRELMNDDAKRIGQQLHRMIASGSTSLKCKPGISKDKWQGLFKEACIKVGNDRIETVYSLYDIDIYIRTMSRLYGNISRHFDDSDKCGKIMTIANDIKYHIDRTLIRSIIYGKRMSLNHQIMLWYFNKLITSYWNQNKSDLWHVRMRIWLRFPFGLFVKKQFLPDQESA